MNRRQFLAGIIATTAIVPFEQQDQPWKRYIERHRRKTQAATLEINRILGVPQNAYGVGHLERIAANKTQALATAVHRVMVDSMIHGTGSGQLAVRFEQGEARVDHSIVFGQITSA